MKYLIILLTANLFFLSCSPAKKVTEKTPDASLKETYWKLSELNGEAYLAQDGAEARIILKSENDRVNGLGGCNSFSGTYMLEAQNRIRFSNIASTKKACPALETETEFFRVLDMTDSYLIKGDTLVLFRARMAPLARFTALYLK